MVCLIHNSRWIREQDLGGYNLSVTARFNHNPCPYIAPNYINIELRPYMRSSSLCDLKVQLDSLLVLFFLFSISPPAVTTVFF